MLLQLRLLSFDTELHNARLKSVNNGLFDAVRLRQCKYIYCFNVFSVLLCLSVCLCVCLSFLFVFMGFVA